MEKSTVIFETERLIIRHFELRDIEHAYQMNLDKEVSRYTGDGGVVDRNEIERRIKDHVLGDYKKHGYGRFAVELKSTGEFIGFTGLKYLEDMDEVDIGFRFKRAHWGKGIATESVLPCLEYGFNVLKLKRIIAMVLPENIGSVNVLKKIGMTYEKEVIEDGLPAHQYIIENPNL